MGTVKVTNIEPIADNGTVTLGGSGDTITLGSGATVTGNGLVGITEADQFRLTANLTNPGSADITSNLERVDDASFAKIGTGMTESSGIFSFPVTGLYLIRLVALTLATNDFHSLGIKVSNDSGSTYDTVSDILSGSTNESVYSSIVAENIVNVTNISTFKVKFSVISALTDGAVRGTATGNETAFTFIRLGDSQ